MIEVMAIIIIIFLIKDSLQAKRWGWILWFKCINSKEC